jgi:hypothetical protein
MKAIVGVSMAALNTYIGGNYVADKQQYEYNLLLAFSWQH